MDGQAIVWVAETGKLGIGGEERVDAGCCALVRERAGGARAGRKDMDMPWPSRHAS